MKKNYLYVVVSVSGASVLALEILGTRILGPFYGVSLFLWSALITVTLAGLSVGYIIGGQLADKEAKMSRLSLIMAAAGIWILFIPLIKHPVLWLAEPFGLRFSVLLAAVILFFPPLTLLGMISPYAVKLKTTKLAEVGRTAGNLYAISTLASVVSALLTGFFLIPYLGVKRFTLLIGLALILTASFGLVTNKKRKTISIGLFTFLLIYTTFFAGFLAEKADPEHGILFIKESPYGEIKVFQDNGVKYLLIDNGIHSMEDVDSGETLQPYAVVLDLAKYFFSEPGEMLLIGLGAGSVAKNYFIDSWKIDAVEIDPVVIEAAQKHFDLKPFVANVFNGDGRQFLLSHDKKYDLIIMDAFGSSSIPFHLITRESFQLIASHLKEGGVLGLNLESLGWKSRVVKSVAKTLTEQFSEVIALPIVEPPNLLGNIVIIGANRTLDFPIEWLGRPADYVDFDPYEHWKVIQLNHAWDNRFRPETKNAKILTDDLNPIDVWAEEINLAYRKELYDYFRKKH